MKAKTASSKRLKEVERFLADWQNHEIKVRIIVKDGPNPYFPRRVFRIGKRRYEYTELSTRYLGKNAIDAML